MSDFFKDRSYKFWLILIFILTIPTFYQLLRPGFFFMQDDLQAFRTLEMFKCFSDFQIPCRWIPDMGYQYGYPQFNFYPPSVYYLGAFFHLFSIQFIDSVKILFILGYVLSTLFMFVFLKTFFDGEVKEKAFENTTLPSLVGAMLYTYVPYKALEVYVRGALSEDWSLVFFPLIFLSIYRLILKQNLKYVIFLALSTSGLMLTHNLMTMIFAPIAMIWCFLLLTLKNAWKKIPEIIFAGLLGIGLAAFFTLPVIFEGKFAHLESLMGGYFDYRQHFVSFERLFISNHFGYGSSGLGQDNDLTLSTGQIHWILGLFALLFALVLFKKYKQMAIVTIIFIFIEVGVLFLIHQKSSFIWERIPILSWLQFPWRFLTDSIFLLSFLGALGIYFASEINKKYAKIFAVIILIGIFILHGQFFRPKSWLNITDADKFSGSNWEKELTISIFDYLPIYAKLPPNKKAPYLPEVLGGKVRFINYQKGSNFQTGQLDVLNSATIRLPLFDFPGMEVLVDGKLVNHWHNDCRGQEYCLGLITFNISGGKHTIKAHLTDTPIRSVGNIVTIISIFIILGIVLAKKYDKNYS